MANIKSEGSINDAGERKFLRCRMGQALVHTRKPGLSQEHGQLSSSNSRKVEHTDVDAGKWVDVVVRT